MGVLDIQTLLLVSTFILCLTSLLTGLAALQARRDPCLLWVATALGLAGLGIAISALRVLDMWVVQVIWFGNMLLILAHASIWAAMCAFSGRPAHRVWLALGALSWSLLCLWPHFIAQPSLRILVFSLICATYTVAAMVQIAPSWRQDPPSFIPIFVVLGVHALFYLFRAVSGLDHFQYWTLRPDTVLTVFFLVLVAVSVAFTSLILVRGREERRYRDASLQDALTRLANRRALFERGTQIVQLSARAQQELTLFMCDLDWFKQVNDAYGHDMGDRVLCVFAHVLRQSVREEDLCARIGGEEFVVLSIGLNSEQALDMARRIRQSLAGQSLEVPIPLSVSIGVAMASDAGYNLDKLLLHADVALYQAKKEGRDCERLWHPDWLVEAAPTTRLASPPEITTGSS